MNLVVFLFCIIHFTGCVAENNEIAETANGDIKDGEEPTFKIDGQYQLAINDIVKRHKKLLEITNYELEAFKNPLYNKDCYKQAIEPILPACIKSGIDSLTKTGKTLIAIRLSLCDFSDGNVEFPYECIEDSQFYNEEANTFIDIQGCIGELFKNPAAWTTYHGYFRDIGKICSQESLPYEKNHLLELYTNITGVYSKYLDNLENIMEESENYKEATFSYLKEFKGVFDNFINETSKRSNRQKEEFNKSINEINNVLKDTSVLSTKIQDDSADYHDYIENLINTVGNSLLDIENTLQKFGISEHLRKYKDETMDIFQEQTNNVQDMLSSIDKVISKTKGSVENLDSTTEDSIKLIENFNAGLSSVSEIVEYQCINAELVLSMQGELLENQNEISMREKEIYVQYNKIFDNFDFKLMETSNKLQNLSNTVDDIADALVGSIDFLNNLSTFLNSISFFKVFKKLINLGFVLKVLLVAFPNYFLLIVIFYKIRTSIRYNAKEKQLENVEIVLLKSLYYSIFIISLCLGLFLGHTIFSFTQRYLFYHSNLNLSQQNSVASVSPMISDHL
ncbi:hypothetical protein PACTADRAFT_31009 [Pachysolen tannophilus NRRL Y-2460]|uniref:Nuclear fusion protein KAR5 n=1 Tax=Pachysolen tannophilus NRRL Y-2460 TaxID=669874 RepID=A0A1E4U0N2_PACTA|nr:hypothetical protein PACTADRAFT_31009 [Pachysolen tannophilus NRRL Y-2460]